MKRFVTAMILVLSIIVMSLAVNAAIQRPVNIADISSLSDKATLTATYREVDAEKGVFALDFAIANSDFCYLGLYLGYDETAIVTCQPDGSDATGLKKTKALEVATKTLDGLDDPVAIDDAEYGWGAFTAKAFDPTNGTISLGLGLGLQADEVLEAHGLVNRIMPKTAAPYHVYTVYFKTVGETTLDQIASGMFEPLTHLVEPWNGSTIFVDAETMVDVPITFVGLPVQPEPPKAENLKGIPMVGNNIDDLIGEGLGGYDAAHHVAQFFSVTQEGTIPQIRYYFPKDFLTQYKMDEYTFKFKFKLYDRGSGMELAATQLEATITEEDLGWYVFDLPKAFTVDANVVYGITVFKGVNGYTGVGDSNAGDFEGKINQPFERPADGFGAWNNNIDQMPNNSYELLGGRHWGTDPVFSGEKAVAEIAFAENQLVTNEGGALEVVVKGSGLENGITVQVFDGNKAISDAWAKGTTEGTSNEQKVTLTFPANASSADKEYTIKASFDGGNTWEDITFKAVIPTADTTVYDGTPLIGAALNGLLETAYGNDAGQNVATFFQVTKPGEITEVRFYFGYDFAVPYTYDFIINIWDRGTQALLYHEKVTDTIEETGWHTFKLTKPFRVEADVVYGAGIMKGINGYSAVGSQSEGTFSAIIGSGFELPADGFGAWYNSLEQMPNNSYELLGGRFWGTDVVVKFDPEPEPGPGGEDDSNVSVLNDYNTTMFSWYIVMMRHRKLSASENAEAALLGTSLMGKSYDREFSKLTFGMDAGQNIATYFQTKKAATIPQVRYYVTQDFLDAMGGSYKFDFRIQLWDRGTQSIVAEETITDTFTKAGWHVFTLETPFKVEAERVYAVSVFKGTNGYLCYGMVSEGSFGNVGNEYAEIPADGFGAWSGGATAWPNNSYELGGGRFWGVDPVFAD